MRFSSSSLAFSWLKRSSHSDCHWVKASEIVETLRSKGCFLKSQEISKESHSALLPSMQCLTRSTILSKESDSISGNFLRYPDSNPIEGERIFNSEAAILEFINPSKQYFVFSLLQNSPYPLLEYKNPTGQNLNEVFSVPITVQVNAELNI